MIAHVQNRPRIGISGKGEDSASVQAMARMVEASGGSPVLLVGHQERLRPGVAAGVSRDLATLDALVVMGNDFDIDPRKYGQGLHPNTNLETDTARATYEEEAIRQALSSGMPLMGVCGGMQRINVLLGGDLHQDLSSFPNVIEHNQKALGLPGTVPVEYVKIEEGTLLSQIARGIKGVYVPGNLEKLPNIVMENSFHHQAVRNVGKGMQVAARSVDGVIEAIEPVANGPLSGQFILGVQWHPEFGASPMGERIMRNVVAAAKDYAREQDQSADLSVPSHVDMAGLYPQRAVSAAISR